MQERAGRNEDEEYRVSTKVARQKLPVRRLKLVAVVPAFNEERNVGGVVSELRALHPASCEVDFVVVDDGSKDGTAIAARRAGSNVVSLPYNMGIGLTVQTGFRYAIAHGAEIVTQVDGDGQHVPSEIEKLLPPLLAGEADVVVGTRFAAGETEGIRTTTFMRWFAGRILAWCVHFLTGTRLTDTTSGFRAFNRGAAEFIANHYPDDYPEVEVLVILVRYGFRITEVPVKMRERAHGRSSINWWRSVYYVMKVLFASFMDKIRHVERKP